MGIKMIYENFDIYLNRRNEDVYRVEVKTKDCGEYGEDLRFPFSRAELSQRVDNIYKTIQGMQGKSSSSYAVQEVRLLGQDLYDFLMSGKFGQLYASSKDRVRSTHKGLRIRIHTSDPLLFAIPWEYLYDAITGDYITFNRKTPVVRYLDLPKPTKPAPIRYFIQILCVISNPEDLSPLDVEHEKNVINNALNSLEKAGKVRIKWLCNATFDELQSELRNQTYHIFHFIGHGGFDSKTNEGVICLTDVLGLPEVIGANRLGRLLEQHNDTLKLVLLNTCDSAKIGNGNVLSSIASTLLRRGVVSVVAMQQKITDKAAKKFAQAFYSSLADGMPIEASMSEARISMADGKLNTLEWGIPVLYMRSSKGNLFTSRDLAANAQVLPTIKERSNNSTIS